MTVIPHVLVTGCPRSGTTAIGEWLLTQPGVAGRLESRITVAAHEYVREVRRSRILADRRPEVFTHLREMSYQLYRPRTPPSGLFTVLVDKECLEPMPLLRGDYDAYLDDVVEVFDSKVVFCVRHPVLTVASMLARKWGYSVVDMEPRAYALDECTRIWCEAVSAMRRFRDRHHGRAVIVRHEDLVSHPMVPQAAMRSHLGLSADGPWLVGRPGTPLPGDLPIKEILFRTKLERGSIGYGEDWRVT